MERIHHIVAVIFSSLDSFKNTNIQRK